MLHRMENTPPLRPAAPDDFISALMFALRFNGRKHTTDGSELMARIVAERLAEHLQRSGFVILQKPPAAAPRVPGP